MKNLNWLDWLTLVLVFIGGLNWGLVGLLDFDLVKAIFGTGIITKIIYDVVGLAAIYLAVISFKLVKKDEVA